MRHPVNTTLVAFYADKPAALRAQLESLLAQLAALGPAFEPYEIAQIHATIIGLESVLSPHTGEPINANYWQLRAEHHPLQLGAALDIARSPEHWPLHIQLGGFQRDQPYAFRSRGQHPYQRSFSLQGEAAVAIGWPCVHDDRLARVRRAFEHANVLHKYHAAPGAQDDDLFFVLGKITGHDPRHAEVEEAVRGWLSRHPLELVLGASDLELVHYVDPSLPLATSRWSRLDETTIS